MLNLTGIPLKKASNVDLVGPLTNLIKSMYSTADQPEDFSTEIDELQKLRKKVTLMTFEDRNAPLDDIFRYYDQIYELEKRIPLNEFMVPFKWKNAYDKGYIFGSRSSLTVSSLSFERICVFFNIGAALSKQAAIKNIDNDEELKLAIKYFQLAASIFDQLKLDVVAILQQDPTSDLTVDALRYISLFMLAQAQELFVQKAIKDKMKNVIIAKLCKQCEFLYENLSNIRVPSEIDDNAHVQAKQNGYHALSEYFQSLICKENKQFGEEIARLQNATAAFKKQQNYSDKIPFFQNYVTIVNRNLEEVLKYNNLIYNEIIPNYDSLPTIEKTALAKIVQVQLPMSAKFKDLFANLIPVVVHQGLAAYDIRKNELVNNEINTLRESDQLLNGILASLNLPAAIEVTHGDDLPRSIVEKADSVKESGGIEKIEKLINELPDLLKVNNDMLQECEHLLREEKESDDNIRKQYKDKWNRTPSEKLTKVFTSNINEYRILVNKAVEADKFVRDKFEAAKKGIKILSLPADEIKSKLPGHSNETDIHCESAKKLRSLMTQVEQVKQEREQIEEELKSKQFDMKEKLIQTLSANGFISEEPISIEALHETYGELQKRIMDNLRKQEGLLTEIQNTHQNFVRESGQSSDSRDVMLKELASAFDAYHSLVNNLAEGTKFYNSLIPIFMGFQNKIKDYCSARKIEKDELLKDLSQASSKSEPPKKPTTPSYYDNTSSTTTTSAPTAVDGPAAPNTLPYPMYAQGMPMPYAVPNVAPYPAYCTAIMPQGYNPFMTLPYPGNYQMSSNPYATYPRSNNNQNR